MSIKQLSEVRLAVLVLAGLWFTSATAFGFDPLRDYSRVDLPKVQKHPKTYKNTEIKFRVYFHQIDDVWSPFFSPFSPSEYVSFSAWDHKKFLWKKKDMVDDFPFLFMKNGSEEINQVLTANKYDLLEVKGVVVSAFKSRPWIEVRHINVLHHQVFTNKQLRHFMLASEANRNGQPTIATQHFEKGLKRRRLPAYAKAEIHKQLAINYFKVSDYQQAIDNVRRYREHAKEEDPTLRNILKRSKKLKKMSPEERSQYEKKRRESKPGEGTGYLTPDRQETPEDPSRLRKKYQTLLSRYKGLLEKNQSLKTKQRKTRERNRQLVRKMKKRKKSIQELEKIKEDLNRKLSEAYQKNGRLLARLHGNETESAEQNDKNSANREERRFQASDRSESGVSNPTGAAKTTDRLREQKLLSRISKLRRRNRSLRSQMTSLTDRNREAQQEINRLRNQVELETSSTKLDQTEDEQRNSNTSDTIEKKSERTGTGG